MKKFFKVLLILILISALGGVGVFVYLTMQGNGGKKETVELLTTMYENAELNLNGLTCEVDYKYVSTKVEGKDTSKFVKNFKIFITYDDDIKKVAIVRLDEKSKFERMDYYEYQFTDSNEIYYTGKSGYVAGCEISNKNSKISKDSYEEDCEFHPEFQIKTILNEISNEKIGIFDNGEKDAKTKYLVDLSTNIFTKVKTIDVVGEVYASVLDTSIDAKYKATVKLKDNLLTSYSNEFSMEHEHPDGDSEGVEKLTINYKYTGGTFNPDKIYNEYAK